jgi:predicted amidohydrolase
MKLTVSLAQIYPRLGDIEYNIKRHIEISREVKGRSQLLVFPELSLTGSNLMDLTFDIAQKKNSILLNPLLEVSKDVDIILGLVELGEDRDLYDSAFYYSDSSLRHIHRKLFLTANRREMRYFTGGDRVEVIDTRFGKLGIVIGEDLLNPISIIPLLKKGADILVVMSNSVSTGYSSTKVGIPESALKWRNLLSIYAQLYSIYVVYVNRVGFEDGLNFFGGSCVIDPYGEVVVDCPYFEESIIHIELDFEPHNKPSHFFDFYRIYRLIMENTYED